MAAFQRRLFKLGVKLLNFLVFSSMLLTNGTGISGSKAAPSMRRFSMRSLVSPVISWAYRYLKTHFPHQIYLSGRTG